MKKDNHDNTLNLEFEDDEINLNSGPVTVLGKTFANDEERRKYFREELRKKLPELKKIEGFPIGSDDDIINLSDPPYYTACPNPWINDFIAEWEQEKLQLEAEGKRQPNVEITEPYAYGVKEGKNSAIYNAHTYHTKVPHELVMRYILHYTQPGDIVLDNFAGTGMTGVATSQCAKPSTQVKSEIESGFRFHNLQHPVWGKRFGINGDLSPLCFHISSNYNDKFNIKILQEYIDKIIDVLNEKFGDWYTINTQFGKGHINYFVWSEIVGCNSCGQELNVHDLSFDYQTNILSKELLCPNCGARQLRKEASSLKITNFDPILQKSVEALKYQECLINVSTETGGRQFYSKFKFSPDINVNGYVPILKLENGDKYSDPKRVGAEFVHQIYCPRILQILSFLYDYIHSVDKDYIKPLMFIFTSMLPKLTRMNRYMPQHGSRALVGPMANTLYIPPQYVENNPIDQFEYQAKKVIKAFKETKTGTLIEVCSATQTPIKSNSIDYIFTDPPFGANIMYSELNAITESWLKVLTNNKEEAISNKTQHKGLFEYQEIMNRCFKEYYRVLKPGKWMTVEFSNTSAAFWNSLQNSIKEAGFIIVAVSDLSKQRGGLHSMISTTAVKQDLAISCFKPSENFLNKFENQDEFSNIWDFVYELLTRLPIHVIHNYKTITVEERTSRILYNRLVSFYVQKGLPVPIDSKEFQKGLRERYAERDGMFFTPSQAVKYDTLRKTTEGFQPTLFFVDSEQGGIAWLNNELTTPQTYQDLQPKWLQAINGVRKNDILPELEDILKENFIKETDGKWRKPNLQDDVDLEALRHKSLMREFNVYVEVANLPNGRIKEARLEALRAGFKQAYQDKDFLTIVKVGDRIPQNLLTEDEQLLQFYEIASSRV